MREGWPEVGQSESDSRTVTALFPISDPFPGYFFTWPWRHRVSELGRGCSWGSGGGPSGQDWRGLRPPFLPLHIGAFSLFPPTGTAGLTPSPLSGSLTSSTSVPMRECHPSKGGAEDGGWSCGPRPVLSCRLHPGAWGPEQSQVPFSAFIIPVEPSGIGSSPSPKAS